MNRLQTVALEFIVADEALRRALLRAEKAERINELMRRMQPPRRWFVNEAGMRELHSLPSL